MSCALWLKNLGCSPCLIDREGEMGGALRKNFLVNDWVLGLEAKTGIQLAEAYAAHMRSARIPFMSGTELRSVAAADKGFRLVLGTGQEERCCRFDALVIAVGTRYRGIETLRDIPGVASLSADVFSEGPHAFADLKAYAGKELLVIGAGDNAYEFAMLVAPEAHSVTLLARSHARAQRKMRESFEKLVVTGRGELLEEGRLVSVEHANGRVSAVVDLPAGRRCFNVDHLVVQAGYVANSDLVLPLFAEEIRKRIQLDPSGHILTTPDQRTDCPAIYAVGDISNPNFPCVVTAVAAGAIAARSIETNFRKQQ